MDGCELCGRPRVSSESPFCESCAAEYQCGACVDCHQRMIWRGKTEHRRCSACTANIVVEGLPTSLLAKLDEFIFQGHVLGGLTLLRSHVDPALSAGLDVFVARYRQLRSSAPDRFTCTDEAYWRGFYS